MSLRHGIDHVKSGSGSSGKWAFIPYCAFLSNRFNKSINGLSATVGFYPAFLLSDDCQELFLVYVIGSQAWSENSLKKLSSSLAAKFHLDGFTPNDGGFRLEHDTRFYSSATIMYKRYTLDGALDPEGILEDLERLCVHHAERGGKILDYIRKSEGLE